MKAGRLLDAWEAGWGRSPLEQALAMLAAGSDRAADELADLTIGQRDRALFELRALLFGSTVDAVSRCPGCGADVELAFDHGALLGPADPAATEVVVDGDRRYRVPTSADLAAALAAGDAGRELVRRCAAGTFDPADDAAVVAAWASAEPVLDIELALSCPECGLPWSEPFDIVSYLWSELDGWCRRTLLEIHDLARVYGWSQDQILTLSGWRRQCYLGLVGS
jgi:hypothetical protein